MIRIAAFLLMLLSLASAEEAAAPVTELRCCASVAEAEQFILGPEEGTEVRAGYVRYIAQSRRDPWFVADYWQVGEDKGELDLTAEANRYGCVYTFFAGNMCTRAAYSMALSYLGVDMTPVNMSVMLNSRDIDVPYDAITARLDGVERVEMRAYIFNTMFANYRADASYSPVYVSLSQQNGKDHTLLLVGYNEETQRFIAVDSSMASLNQNVVRVYEIVFSTMRDTVMKCPQRSDLVGAEVVQVHQWRLTPETSIAPDE